MPAVSHGHSVLFIPLRLHTGLVSVDHLLTDVSGTTTVRIAPANVGKITVCACFQLYLQFHALPVPRYDIYPVNDCQHHFVYLLFRHVPVGAVHILEVALDFFQLPHIIVRLQRLFLDIVNILLQLTYGDIAGVVALLEFRLGDNILGVCVKELFTLGFLFVKALPQSIKLTLRIGVCIRLTIYFEKGRNIVLDILRHILEVLGQHFIKVGFKYGKGRTRLCAETLFLAAYPLVNGLALGGAVGVACAPVGFVIGGADYLARENAPVFQRVLPRLNRGAPGAEYLVALVPKLLADDRRHHLPRFVLVHHPFVLREKALLLGAVVDYFHLVAAVKTFVLRILYYARYGIMMYACAVAPAVAFVVQYILNFAYAVLARGVLLKDKAHHFRLALVYSKAAVLFVVAENAVVAHYVAVFDSTLVSPADALGQLAHLVCSDTGHYGKAQLAVGVYGADIVILKKHPHTRSEQLTGVGQAVNSVTGKTADLLGEYEVERARLAVLDHAHKIGAVDGVLSADAVDVALDISPVFIALDEVGEEGYLIFYGVFLLLLSGGNACIEGYSQLKVKDVFLLIFHFVGGFVYIHL